MSGDQEYSSFGVYHPNTAAGDWDTGGLGLTPMSATRHYRVEALQYALGAYPGGGRPVDQLLDDAAKILAWLSAVDEKPAA